MMITQGYVWMLAEIYLGTKDNPDACSEDEENTGANHAASSEMENHKARTEANRFKSKHEDTRACDEDERRTN